MTGLGPMTRLALTALVLGCATHRPAKVSNPFIRQGKPTVDFGGPAPSASTESFVAQLRKLAAEARPRAKSSSPDVAETRDPALRDKLAVLRATPTAQHHRDVALEYRRLGILDAAYSHLSTAIRLNPKDAAAYDLRARIWRAWGLPQLGLRDARKAVDLAPQSATAWNTLGLILEGSGNLNQGIQAYLRSAVLDGDAGYAWINLCRLWTTQPDPTSAVQACRRALSLEPTHRQASLNLQRAEQLLAPPPGPAIAAQVAAYAHTDSGAADERTPLPSRPFSLDSRRAPKRGSAVHR